MGLILFCAALLLTITGSGKALMVMLSDLPLIGPWIDWYQSYIGPLGDGYLANFTYAGMSLVVMTFLLSPILWGPNFVKKSICLLKSLRKV